MGRPTVSLNNAEFPRAQGPVDAPIQIIEYSDFQCPACGNAQPMLNALLQDHPGKIRLVYQHFPLDSHQWSRLVHQAAECAARQNRFWPYHDRLYQNQSGWSKSTESPVEILIRYAKEEGLNLEAFGRCLQDPEAARKIREERMTGEGLGVRSTPSFFVNGEMVAGTKTLREKIERFLAE
jgi:protein-disulfide isomerase